MPGFDDTELDLGNAFTPPVLEDNSPFPFGKYKDTRMQDVPAEYLVWLNEQDWLKGSYASVYNYIQKSWSAINQ